MENNKYMSIKEFREEGFLQELNRQFLHPLGLALEVSVQDDGTQTLGGIWDYRDDPEGITFGHTPDPAKAAKIKHLQDEKAEYRKRKYGWVIQPITATDNN